MWVSATAAECTERIAATGTPIRRISRLALGSIPEREATLPCSLLLHLEVRQVRGTVLQSQRQDVAGIRVVRRLPVVDELIGRRIVTENRATSRRRIERRAQAEIETSAGHDRILQRRERAQIVDVIAVGVLELPLDRIRPAGVAGIDDRRIVDWLQEPDECVDDVVRLR